MEGNSSYGPGRKVIRLRDRRGERPHGRCGSRKLMVPAGFGQMRSNSSCSKSRVGLECGDGSSINRTSGSVARARAKQLLPHASGELMGETSRNFERCTSRSTY